MFKKPILAISLLLPLTAMSAAAHAGQTITDKSYWPNEIHQSVEAEAFGSRSKLNSAFAFDRSAYGLPNERSAEQSVATRGYRGGGPKFQ